MSFYDTPYYIKKALQEQEAEKQRSMGEQAKLVQGGGYTYNANMLRRANDYNYGLAQGQKEFYDDKDMQTLRAKREDLAKGYSGEELGNIRESARREVAGNRSNYLRALNSNLARGGVGGARAAAIRGSADQKYNETVADNERKMALDSANMVRTGTSDLQDFLFRQKYGKLGLAMGNAQLGSADYAAEQARQANSGGGSKGFCFITTAACEFFGLPDDCDELQTLRGFRDNVMLASEGWKDDVKAYYELSKELGPKLSEIKDKEFWSQVFEFIKKSVAHVKAGENNDAYNTYKELVEFVKGA